MMGVIYFMIKEVKENLSKGFISVEEFKTKMKENRSKWATSIVEDKRFVDSTVVKTYYYNLSVSFDIETTAVEESKSSYMYIWMLCIDGYCTYGRTWHDFAVLLRDVGKILCLSRDLMLPVYVHNLGYEASFLLPRFKHVYNLFGVEAHRPIRFRIPSGYEFRDSAILSGLSLAETANNLTQFSFRKRVGNLDYSKPRNSHTPLTNEEMGYCLDDVRTLCAYIEEQINQYGDVTKIPMTNTGRVRDYTRKKCLYKINEHGEQARNQDYGKLMRSLTITPNEYDKYLKPAYWGGYTHASHINQGSVKKKVHSMDFTSSYPAVMVSEKFPMTAGEYIEYSKWSDYFEDMNNGYLFIGAYEFFDLDDSKFPYEHYLSSSNCKSEGSIEDNGRIVCADRVVVICTNVDFDLIRSHYAFSKCKVYGGYRYKADYLPKEFILSILHLYSDKTKLKGVAGAESEYLLKKGMVNSTYGMAGTDIVRGLIEYDEELDSNEGWRVDPAILEKEIGKNNKARNKIVSFPWADFITAFARKNLWSAIDELKSDYIYSDTDSVKYMHKKMHEQYFNDYNKQISDKIFNMCKHYGIDPELTYPATIKGVRKPLGVWDYEGYYQKFKTLGSKRYMFKKYGKLYITVAGINKKTAGHYIAKVQKETNPFDFFSDGVIIPKKYSGKICARYYKEYTEDTIIDEFGNEETMHEYGGCYLYPVDYRLCIGAKYKEYLETMKNEQFDLTREFASIQSRLNYREYKNEG